MDQASHFPEFPSSVRGGATFQVLTEWMAQVPMLFTVDLVVFLNRETCQ